MTTATDDAPPPLIATITEAPAVGLDQANSSHNEATPKTTHKHGTTTPGVMSSSPSDESDDLPTTSPTPSTGSGAKRHHSAVAVSWEDFARRGSRFKTFFQEAASEMIEQYTNNRKSTTTATNNNKRFKPHHHDNDGDINDSDNENKENHTTTTTTSSTAATTTDQSSSVNHNTASNPGLDHLNKLVEEHYVENMQLRRKLETAETEHTTLTTTQKSLRDEVSFWKNRCDRTLEALRIAEKNASNARVDADLAETNAAQLAQTLQSLQTVVNETKLACQKLAEDQQLVDQKASDIETRYLKQKQELLRITKDAQQLRQTNALLEHARDQWKQERKSMEQKVKALQVTIASLQREATDQAAVEKLRMERAAQDQAELREAQQLLTHATEHHATNMQVQTTLQETVQTLETANAEMHDKLSEQLTAARNDSERLSTALSKAEREAQKLRLDKEALEEELKRTKLDKDASAKQIQELKQRVIAAERANAATTTLPTLALTPPTTTTTPPPSNDHHTENDQPPNKIVFRLPPLPGSAKERKSNCPDVISGQSCCICYKPSFGIMKSCTCGNCQERAHLMCVKQVTAPPSVSHPGTPAAPLPIVLCKLHRPFSSAQKQK